jgi:hypothetical protein
MGSFSSEHEEDLIGSSKDATNLMVEEIIISAHVMIFYAFRNIYRHIDFTACSQQQTMSHQHSMFYASI